MAQSIQVPVPIPTGDAPEGKVAVSYDLDLSSGQAVINIQTYDKNISVCRAIHVSNESNRDVTCVVGSTGQKLVFSANTEEYDPIISGMPLQLTFTCALGIDKHITVILLNHELPFLFGK
jgi:hypothetical protein